MCRKNATRIYMWTSSSFSVKISNKSVLIVIGLKRNRDLASWRSMRLFQIRFREGEEIGREKSEEEN